MPDLSYAHTLAAAQHGVITRAQALECGLSTGQIDRLVRGCVWRRLRPGVYLVHGTSAPVLAARVMAAQLVYGPRAVAVGPTAARLWRLQGPLRGPGHETVHLSLPDRPGRRSAGVRLHGWVVTPEEVTLCGGIRLSTPARTLRDTILLTDRYSAVSVIDSALQKGLVSADDLPALAAANAGRAGARRTRTWWDRADGRAQSTFETRIRLICHDAGIPPETLQYPVYDPNGDIAGRADLAWPSRGVVAEADGAGPHALPEALYSDRRRQNSMVSGEERLVVLRFTWRDLQHPRAIVAMVRDACRIEHGAHHHPDPPPRAPG